MSDLNGLAYNPLDGYLYAVTTNGVNSQLIRISATGTSEVLGVLGLGATNIRMGEITPDGIFWLMSQVSGETTTIYYEVDLVPGSATFGRLLASGTSVIGYYDVFDWAYSSTASNTRYLVSTPLQRGIVRTWRLLLTCFDSQYSIGTNSLNLGTYLMRFDLDTHTWVAETAYLSGGSSIFLTGSTTQAFGGVFGANNGFIYGIESYTGRIYQFPLANVDLLTVIGITLNEAVYLGTVPMGATTNDAAHCYLSGL